MINPVRKKDADPKLVELGFHCDEWRYDYKSIVEELSFLEITKPDAFHEIIRMMGNRDFWFFCYAVLGLPVNDPYLMARCYEIDDNEDNDSLYLWFRDGWKSSLVTYARSLWRLAKTPGLRIAIFSNSLKLAKPHFKLIMHACETNTILKRAWSDIFWEDPARNREITWSMVDGLYLKQNNRKEPSVSCHGLIDAMPTGLHVDERVIDDLVDIKNVGTRFMMEKVMEAYQMADNLSSGENTTENVIGTRYRFGDLYEWLMGLNQHRISLIPAEVDEKGEAEYGGRSVFLSKAVLDKKKIKQAATYHAQLLQQPLEKGEAAFKTEWLRYYDNLPDDLRYFITVDPGTNPDLSLSKDLDYTAMWLLGTSKGRRIFVVDMVHDRIGLKEKWTILKDWHLRYNIEVCGYEEYGTQKDREFFMIKMEDEKFFFNITRLKGNKDNSTSKDDRISSLIEFFSEGKIYLPRTCHRMTRANGVKELVESFVKEEYELYPMIVHEDRLDALARIADPDLKIYYPAGEVIEEKQVPRYQVSPLDEHDTTRECFWGDL